MSQISGARVDYDVFGTSASPTTLTTSYVVGKVLYFDGLKELTLSGQITTGSLGEFLDIRLETSPDGTNFFVYGETSSPDASPPTRLDIAGTPYRLPKEVASPSAATTYRDSFTVRLQARYIRISCKSSLIAGFGTAWVHARGSEV